MAKLSLHFDRDSDSSTSNGDEEEEEDVGGERSEIGIQEYPISSLLIVEAEGEKKKMKKDRQDSIIAMLVSAVRRSIGACSVDLEWEGEEEEEERERVSGESIEIGWPTDVRHVTHVTFDRFDGFLGLPAELVPQVPGKVPSASVSVFGVSASSMQCTYDKRGNSVPSILLLMQGYLYSQGGLKTEGIFRINAENGQELYVREQLNKGIVPQGVDLHCLAGLIKAWFRELPSGVLDSLTPDQVMRCNTEEECSRLVSVLPITEAALLDWAINLMTDVAEHECHNKMNARSISMVFAPNMTQMADPLTALIYAVQVMNFLRTLVLKTMRERSKNNSCTFTFESCHESFMESEENITHKNMRQLVKETSCNNSGFFDFEQSGLGKDMLQDPPRLPSDSGEESFHSFGKTNNVDRSADLGTHHDINTNKDINDGERLTDRLRSRNGLRKLCWHPIFQLSKPVNRLANMKGKRGEIGGHEMAIRDWG